MLLAFYSNRYTPTRCSPQGVILREFRELGQRKTYFVDPAHKMYQNSLRTSPFGLKRVEV